MGAGAVCDDTLANGTERGICKSEYEGDCG